MHKLQVEKLQGYVISSSWFMVGCIQEKNTMNSFLKAPKPSIVDGKPDDFGDPSPNALDQNTFLAFEYHCNHRRLEMSKRRCESRSWGICHLKMWIGGELFPKNKNRFPVKERNDSRRWRTRAHIIRETLNVVDNYFFNNGQCHPNYDNFGFVTDNKKLLIIDFIVALTLTPQGNFQSFLKGSRQHIYQDSIYPVTR